MQLQHITGNSYFLEGDNCIGVYVFADRSCLLVDSGASESQAKKILHCLTEAGLQIDTIFTTHAHVDHCGGNQYLQSQCQCRVMASSLAAAILENPMLGPAMLFTAYPLRVLRSRVLMAAPCKVNQTVSPGPLLIQNELFQVYDLPGHSLGQTGLATPDGVLFLGDSLMHTQMLQEYPFLYMVDITGKWRPWPSLAAINGLGLCCPMEDWWKIWTIASDKIKPGLLLLPNQFWPCWIRAGRMKKSSPPCCGNMS
jgi:glyoxylase-like metal-dependent hydrolase (beta-lactamase superfamily II)